MKKIEPKEIQELFENNNWTLSLAESCTGGNMAAQLVKLPGASSYFIASIVAYSCLMKQKLLGVSQASLNIDGPVNGETVSAMVKGLLKLTQSDFGVAISGIAGPAGGTKNQPVGTIWMAVAKQGKPVHTKRIQATGHREMIIQSGVDAALAELFSYCSRYIRGE